MNRPAELPDDPFGPDADADAGAIDRLLGGRIHPEHVPARYREMARTLRALTSPPSHDELADEPVAVRRALVLLERSPQVHRRRASRSLMARSRVAALVVAGTMLGTAGAAVANVLPGPLERPVAQVLSHVGITIEPADDEHGVATATSRAPRVFDGPSARIAPPSSVPPTGVERGAAVSGAASDGKSRAGQQPAERSHGGASGTAHGHAPRGHERAPGRANGTAVHAKAGGHERGTAKAAPAAAAARASR